jgi:formaldehyde-activating enzyme involved in methanogenesis
VPLDAWGRPEDDDLVVIVASWVYVGSREQRRIAREELNTTASAVAA